MKRLIIPDRRLRSEAFLYIIAEPHGAYKIGFAIDVEQRLATLQAATPYELTVLRKVPRRDVRQAELAVHGLLARYHLRGEWFKLPSVELFDEALADRV